MTFPLHNPHLPGDPFFWQAGTVGALLMHGLTATPVEVRGLAQRLHRVGYTVAGPLLPGHGTVPADLNQVTWHDWVATAVADYHHLATICDHVFVGGESTGAVIALYLAARYPDIAGVLAYAPAIRLNLDRLTRLKMVLAAPFLESVPKEGVNQSEEWQGYPVNPLGGAVQLLRLQKATREILPHVSQPVLVVQGRHDTTIHPESGRIILDHVGSHHKEYYLMANSNHVVLLDQELDAITSLTIDFMAYVSGQRGIPHE